MTRDFVILQKLESRFPVVLPGDTHLFVTTEAVCVTQLSLLGPIISV